jgi:hypothetical protein
VRLSSSPRILWAVALVLAGLLGGWLLYRGYAAVPEGGGRADAVNRVEFACLGALVVGGAALLFSARPVSNQLLHRVWLLPPLLVVLAALGRWLYVSQVY